MSKRPVLILVILFSLFVLSNGPVFAGDVSTFVNMGFSDNSQYFMFGQYGIEEDFSTLYAELFIVNVKANTFTTDGIKKGQYKVDILPGQEGMGSLFNLLEANASLPVRFGINHLKTGRLLYILLNGEEPKTKISFRDFNTGNLYEINLVQAEYHIGSEVSASFSIDLSITDTLGNSKNLSVGRPGYKRKGVKTYKIRQIFLSPSENSIVFLIEKEEKTEDGVNVRYMVETAALK